MSSASRYDRFCDRAYSVTRAWLAPTLRNSQYEYRAALLGPAWDHVFRATLAPR